MKKDIVVPNLGGVEGSKVIELLVKPKQKIKKDMPLMTLESDKASMDIPSPFTGMVGDIKIKEGDIVAEGDVILSLSEVEEEKIEVIKDRPVEKVVSTPRSDVYASPFVRRMAFELGIDLSTVKASGSGGRVTMDDMKSFLLKSQLKVVDYSQWGKVKFEAFSKVQSASATHLIESWQTVPQVTQHHWIDITALELKRKSLDKKITMVAFVMKAMADNMLKHSAFCRGWVNPKEYASRNYIHIGIAVDTGNGLMVPVCRDVDQKDVFQLATEVKILSQKVRDGKIKVENLKGRCASVSSLGSIGGGHFTPIVSSPDSCVIGISKAVYQGVYQGDKLVKRFMLPISLSYDHRLIDGADAARFLVDLEKSLVEMPNKIGE